MISSMNDYLPELEQFTRQLADDYTTKHLTEGKFIQECDAFYTSEMMQKINALTNGWIKMASYQNSATLYHVTSVLVALYLLPEFQAATGRQKRLMQWTVLFHDIAKVPVKNGHDYVHGFKSSAIAGNALTKLGFPLNEGQSQQELDDWYDLTDNAVVYDNDYSDYIQDNSKLPEIITGLRSLHGNDAYCIVTAILFHISIKSDPYYPIPAPLTDMQIKQFITPDNLPIITAMLLVDNDGWCLFDTDRSTQQRRREQTLTVFKELVNPLVFSTP